MADTLEGLKKIRGVARAAATRILKGIEAELKRTVIDVDTLEELLTQLTVKNEKLKGLDEQVEGKIVSVEDLEADATGCQEYEEQIIMWRMRAERAVRRNVNHEAADSKRASVNLPKLNIERFDGDMIHWQTFWNQFEVAINSNEHLSKAEKFTYLKTYLGGAASSAVSGLQISNDNYDSALRILKDRFGRKDLVITSYMNKLLNLSPVKRSSDLKALRTLYDECEIQVRSLQAMGVLTESYGNLLCPILMKLIPEDIALEFSRRRDSDQEWEVMELLNISVRILLDGGSQRTFVKEDISRKLGLPVVRKETISIYTFGSDKPRQFQTRRVRVLLTNIKDSNVRLELEALESPQLCNTTISLPKADIYQQMRSKGLDISDYAENQKQTDGEISLLIGSDYYWKVLTGKMERLSETIVAMDTKFGWTIQGPESVLNFSMNNIVMNKIECASDENLSDRLRSFWELESLGITDSPEIKHSELEIIRKFESSIVHTDGRYAVRLPWNGRESELADNFHLAKGRLLKLNNRFKHDPVLFERYNEVIVNQIKEGIVEYVDERDEPYKVVHYLPHQAVIREDKSTKVRIVFDASAHQEGSPSLNDCLLTGPNLNPNILGMLVRFRKHGIALTADIEKAFHQISLAPSDRDAIRFLWSKPSTIGLQEAEIMKLRMTRVPFGLSSSPFLLANTIRFHIEKQETKTKVCQTLNDDLYVDDLITGADDENNALQIYTDAKEILKGAGMNLRNWHSNSPALRSKFVSRVKKSQEKNQAEKLFVENFKVLGLSWNPYTDELKFDLRALQQFLSSKKNTKRCVLQTAARLFDPIGFITPFVIRIKYLFQEMWERGLQWDSELPYDMTLKWQQWTLELPNLSNLSIPRCYFNEKMAVEGEIQLHCFSDASKKAYGAVLYIRYVTENKEVKTSFVISKARVAPLRKLTLPRLELMGALIAARLINFIRTHFSKIQRIYLWTDSTIALHWIKGNKRQWKPFVGNRVEEIQSLTNPENWSHCEGKSNPADYLTRGLTVDTLISSELWWTGPKWLYEGENSWPGLESNPNAHNVDNELHEEERDTIQVNVNYIYQTESVLNLSRYSSLHRVLRVTAWIMRFIQNVRKNESYLTGPLNNEELQAAENYWIKTVQRERFPNEMHALENGNSVDNKSKILELNPQLDEKAIMRLRSRLQESDCNPSEMNPYILPPDHRFTELLIISCHQRLLHSGVRDTLVSLREKYWIVRGRRIVSSVISKCLICQRMKSLPVTQTVAPLPRDRVIETPPFETSGVDYAGPLYCKEGEKTVKSYILIFTCAVTRAIHLELTPTLTTKDFLLAFRRFISRRGICRTLYSDNAKTFTRANKELKSIWKEVKTDELQDYFGKHGIKWKFIVERGAWWGGFWERMIKTVKGCLRKILGRAILNSVELQTTLTEIEAIVNSRPITYVYKDPQEWSPLTPAHFLIGSRITSLPSNVHSEGKTYSKSTQANLVKRLKYRETLLRHFWNRWKREYLLDLRSAHLKPTGIGERNLQVNDIVLINEDKIPRHMWKLGRVDQTFIGRDNRIRSCTVQLPNGLKLKRPVQLLHHLEVRGN